MTRSIKILCALLAVWSIVLVGLGVQVLHEYDAQKRTADDAASTVALAEAQVLGLTTLDYRHVDAQVAAMIDRTTGDFHKQFELIAKTFEQVVNQSSVIARGRIVAAGVASLSRSRAIVLVASKAQVQSKNSARPSARTYRMRVTLERGGHSPWLISNMEFVP